MYEDEIKPVGGPCGYLYNLTHNTNDFKNEIEISFLKKGNSKNKGKVINNSIKYMLQPLYDFYEIVRLYIGNKKVGKFDDFDVIHFHRTIDLFAERKNLKNFKGKVLIQSHSPKPLHQEIYEDWFTDLERLVLGKLKKKMYEIIDTKAFYICDYIVFPCEEAEEPYYKRWKNYEKIKNKNKNKYLYILSGVIKKEPKISKESIYNNFDLNNKFVISYVGRHIESKGYDDLKKYAINYFKKNDNVRFLICGKEEPLKGLDDKRWIEVGWTTDSDSYINASDVFVLPNKETYFDLVLLEALSMGKIIVASNTGGNKYFKNFENSAIYLYGNYEEFIKYLTKIANMSIEEIKLCETINKKIYNTYFSDKVFLKNYIEMIKGIL